MIGILPTKVFQHFIMVGAIVLISAAEFRKYCKRLHVDLYTKRKRLHVDLYTKRKRLHVDLYTKRKRLHFDLYTKRKRLHAKYSIVHIVYLPLDSPRVLFRTVL